MSKNLTVPSSKAIWPRVGLGTWNLLPAETAKNIVYEAIKSGYRHIDCAAVYGNEIDVGLGIERAIKEGIVTRENLWITSKLWNTSHAKEHVEEACLRTLSDLKLEYLDLYIIHFPVALKYVDPKIEYPTAWANHDDKVVTAKVPLWETWAAMESLVDKKLAKHIGVSNFELQLLQDLLNYCRIKPITNQVEMHPFFQQKNMLHYCNDQAIVVTGYSPLGGQAYLPLDMASPNEPHVLNDKVLTEIAKAHKKTTAQIALKWSLQRAPLTAIIPKSNHSDRVALNIDLFDFELTKDQMDQIANLDRKRRYNDTAIYTRRGENYLPIFS